MPERRKLDEVTGLLHDALNRYQVAQTRVQIAQENLAKSHQQSELANQLLHEAMTLALRLATATADRVELSAVAQEVADTLAGGVLPGVEVLTEPGPGRLWADVDRMLLVRALDNMVRNAAEAMPAGGTVTIATMLQNEGQMVCIQVRDTGCGMDEATLARIWEPGFTTKDKATRPRGLGLSNVKRFVEAHGGTVRVESTVGKGSVFEACFQRVLEAA